MRHKEGALQAKPIPQVANKVAISINSKQSNSKQPSKADVVSKVDNNSSSDDDIDMVGIMRYELQRQNSDCLMITSVYTA